MNIFAPSRLTYLPTKRRETRNAPASASADELLDEVLLGRIATGEQAGLAYLFQRYARLVRSIAVRILRDATEADDLVQDLFVCLRSKCAMFDGSKGSAGSWVVHMAYQKAIERRRYLATRHFYSHEDVEGTAAAGIIGKVTNEDDYSPDLVFGRNGLTKILEALSQDQRETLLLFFFEGYTLAEISKKLGQPLGNVRHHYYRGLDKLRKQMFGRKVRGIETK